MYLAFRIGAAIDEESFGGFVPPEPHRRGLWRPLRIHSGQPDYTLIAQAARHPLAKWCRWVRKLKWHCVSSTFSKMIVSGTWFMVMSYIIPKLMRQYA